MIISVLIIIFTMIVKIPIFALLKMNENMGQTAVIYKYANHTGINIKEIGMIVIENRKS